MKRWLTSLFVAFALAGGTLAGMPLHSGKMNSQMMKCCDKAKGKGQSPEVTAARLCCALNCTDPVPTPGSSFNFSSQTVVLNNSISKQIAFLLRKERPVTPVLVSFEHGYFLQESHPKYLQHHSFLI